MKSTIQIYRYRSLLKDELGAVQIEFALTALLVLTVIFMTLELVSAVYTYTVLSDAANEGLRYAIVHSGDTAGAEAKVRTYAAYSLHDVSAMSVAVNETMDGSAVPPNRVSISVSYTYIPYLSFMSNPPTMHAYAEGRLVN
jgi:Flp pilus assembly protein TadG